jgi:cob(I)alamin adenosyltransferase
MGCLHVYTGEGKGKTSAAFGAAFRAFGRDLRVHIVQFLKHKASGEALSWERLTGTPVELFGSPRAVGSSFVEADLAAAQDGWADVLRLLQGGEYDLLVMDELCVALGKGLLDCDLVVPALLEARASMELIVTGRHAPQVLMDQADLVTEFRCLRHPAMRGQPPRRGIEF